jgi:hypothetical protein
MDLAGVSTAKSVNKPAANPASDLSLQSDQPLESAWCGKAKLRTNSDQLHKLPLYKLLAVLAVDTLEGRFDNGNLDFLGPATLAPLTARSNMRRNKVRSFADARCN